MIYDRAKVVPWTNALTHKEMYSAALKFTKSRKWIFLSKENGDEKRTTLFETEQAAQDFIDRTVENLKKRGMWSE